MEKREFKSTNKIRSRCATVGKMMPTEFKESLFVHMIGDIGEAEKCWFNLFYYWIIIYIVHGNPICIVIIFYLIVNNYGFAHPKKDINKDALRELSEAAGKSQFVIISKVGEKESTTATRYLGFSNKILQCIKRTLDTDDNLEAFRNYLPSEVYQRMLIDGTLRQDETSIKEYILYLRKLQMLVDLLGDSTTAKRTFTDLVVSAAQGLADDDRCVSVTPILLPDDTTGLTEMDIIYFYLMSCQVPVSRILPETTGNLEMKVMVDMLISSNYQMVYNPQVLFHEDGSTTTGRYLDDMSFSSCCEGRDLLREKLGDVELTNNCTVISVYKNDTFTGFITVSTQDTKERSSTRKSMKQLEKELDRLFPKGTCQKCSLSLDIFVLVDECCHAGKKRTQSRCSCLLPEDRQRVDEINDVLGRNVVTFMKDLDPSSSVKRKLSDDNDITLCEVCKTNVRCAMQLPCNHLLLCSACCRNQTMTCIRCNQEIENFFIYNFSTSSQGQGDSSTSRVKLEHENIKVENVENSNMSLGQEFSVNESKTNEDESDDYYVSDDDNVLYCTCRQPHGHRSMILCSNDACIFKWFHKSCVNLDENFETEFDWFCPDCLVPSDNDHDHDHDGDG